MMHVATIFNSERWKMGMIELSEYIGCDQREGTAAVREATIAECCCVVSRA